MKVGIIGLGGLGQIAARVGVLKGAHLHVAEPKQDVWPLAERLGAEGVVASATEWRGQDFDLVVDYASTRRAPPLRPSAASGSNVSSWVSSSEAGMKWSSRAAMRAARRSRNPWRCTNTASGAVARIVSR